ncbi:hypothetical protein DPMN_055514 [Dreissena polymorpha]|uniref:Uncharacterized protein n=1 Tax=Dreissena polymorpha TaxID=45954 RepID=A0A9D4CQ41_DREPO|nr:hypothetical protein DPMN_055514 [Dreissena polymorpha]
MFFFPIQTVFELNRRIRKTNVLTKFHEDWANIRNCPPPGGHAFPPIMTIFELVLDIYKIDAKIFTSRVKMTPFPGGHVCLPIRMIFEFNRRIQIMKIGTKISEIFHYKHIEKTAPPPGGHVFSPIWIIFVFVRDINEINVLTKNTNLPPGGHTNILTKLHEDWASNVTSTVFKSFELGRVIIGTNVLTPVHEDRTINVASIVFISQNVDDERRTTHDGQKMIPKAHHEHVELR